MDCEWLGDRGRGVRRDENNYNKNEMLATGSKGILFAAVGNEVEELMKGIIVCIIRVSLFHL